MQKSLETVTFPYFSNDQSVPPTFVLLPWKLFRFLDQRIEPASASVQVDELNFDRVQELEQELAAAKARIRELESSERLQAEIEAEASVDFTGQDDDETFLRTPSHSQASVVPAPVAVPC